MQMTTTLRYYRSPYETGKNARAWQHILLAKPWEQEHSSISVGNEKWCDP